MNVLLFLLETLFFVLLAAALLRAWMNHLKISFGAQPGPFVLAVTQWLVSPVRRLLPVLMQQSRFDWGSLMAAFLLALAYGGIQVGLMSMASVGGVSGGAVLLTILALALKILLRTLLQGLMVLVLIYAVFSWVQPDSPVQARLDRLCAPVLRPVRRWVPLVGGVDLSVLVLVLLLQIGLMLVA